MNSPSSDEKSEKGLLRLAGVSQEIVFVFFICIGCLNAEDKEDVLVTHEDPEGWGGVTVVVESVDAQSWSIL